MCPSSGGVLSTVPSPGCVTNVPHQSSIPPHSSVSGSAATVGLGVDLHRDGGLHNPYMTRPTYDSLYSHPRGSPLASSAMLYPYHHHPQSHNHHMASFTGHEYGIPTTNSNSQNGENFSITYLKCN